MKNDKEEGVQKRDKINRLGLGRGRKDRSKGREEERERKGNANKTFLTEKSEKKLREETIINLLK